MKTVVITTLWDIVTAVQQQVHDKAADEDAAVVAVVQAMLERGQIRALPRPNRQYNHQYKEA